MNLSQSNSPAEIDSRAESRIILPAFITFYFAAFYLFSLLSGAAALPQNPPAASLLPSLFTAWLGATVAIGIVWLLLQSVNQRRALVLIVAGVAFDISCNFLAIRFGQERMASGAVPGALTLALLAAGNLGVLAAATGAGILVARGLQKPNYLVMAAIVGALTDIFSVYAGPSKHVVSSTIFPYLSFQWGVWGLGVIPCVGAGDFIFLALYLSGAKKFNLSERKTILAMVVAFALGFLFLLISPAGIPALPFMSTLLLVVHARDLKKLMADEPRNRET